MLTVTCRWCGMEYQTTCEDDVYCSQVCMDADAEDIEESMSGPQGPVPCKPGPPLL